MIINDNLLSYYLNKFKLNQINYNKYNHNNNFNYYTTISKNDSNISSNDCNNSINKTSIIFDSSFFKKSNKFIKTLIIFLKA